MEVAGPYHPPCQRLLGSVFPTRESVRRRSELREGGNVTPGREETSRKRSPENQSGCLTSLGSHGPSHSPSPPRLSFLGFVFRSNMAFTQGLVMK